MSGVTVICPNSRRCIVKVTPSTHLRKVLEEACLKQGFDVDTHELKHHNRVLDGALPFRLSGLPNNATVEMIRISRASGPANVEIALQISDGSRKLCTLNNELTLLDVLTKFSSEFGDDLLHCGDGKIPVCVYMNKEYRGEAELSVTTLKSIGISSGRSLIRYSAQKVSEEELSKIADRLSDEKARKEKLSEGFDARRAENQRREQIERQREEDFERERCESEESTARRLARHEGTSTLNSERKEATATSTTGASEESSNSVTTSSSGSTHTALATGSPLSRLEHLQSLLSHVNMSLNLNTEDFFADHLVTENGRIDLNVQAPLSNLATQQQPSNSADFRFPNASQEVSSVRGPEAEVHPLPLPRVCTTKCDRKAMVVVKDKEASASTPSTANIDDKFFELTVHDAQSLQRDLREQVRAHEQRALIPREFIAQRNRELKEDVYKHTVIRFQLADKTTIQALFLSREPVSHIYEFIANGLQDRRKRFDLCFALNQKVPNDADKHLIDAGLAPTSTVFVRFHEKVNDYALLFCKTGLTETTRDEADSVSKQWLSANGVLQRYDPRVADESLTAQNVAKRQADSKSDYGGPSKHRPPSPSISAPKWFKKK
ncbi:Tether containing UBX domain for GLUT4 [Toxocara canis]|uniref:Tether containing UBX domain for GLUT4 n=1 Tax=Toxocara canis TaxID=6265 RepID=A0A0B2V5I0_TOXCA|nr:Tether containing UBX domain for GLUT4 [Toxocara canis]